MSILFDNPPPAIGCGDPGDPIDYGCLFDGGQVLERAFTSSEEGEWTLSAWVKITDPDQSGPSGASLLAVAPVGGSSPNNGTWFGYLPGQSPQGFYVLNYAYQGSPSIYARFDRLWRDPAAWAHIYLSYSIERPVGSRYVMRVNGGLIEDAFYNSSVDEFNRAARHAIGGHIPLDGGDAIPSTKAIFADYHFVSGREVAFTEFAYRNSYGHWVPKRYQGDYGDNGFHLNFADPLDLGKDVSGNNNHFTASGLTADNQVKDTPTNDCATLNPLSSGTLPLSFGNRRTVNGATVQGRGGTMLLPEIGVWCWETKINVVGNAWGTGIMRSSASADLPSPDFRIYMYHGRKYDGAEVDYAAAWSDGDIIGTVFKSTDGTLEFFRNGVSQGVAYTGIDPSEGWVIAQVQRSADRVLNSGQKPMVFEYPYGAKPLATAYLPCPAILNPDDYFTSRKVGDNSPLPWNPNIQKTLAVTKDRDHSVSWRINDTVRGDGKAWACDVGGTEINEGSSGVTWTDNGPVYGSADEYQGNRITWFWRASPKAGFDIVLVNHNNGVATTVPHKVGGLVQYAWEVPLDGGDVVVFHHKIADNKCVILNSNEAAAVVAGGPITSTANTVTIPSGRASGRKILYLWRGVPQFSDFGERLGDGNVDGPLYLADFAPRLLIGRPATARDAYLYDCDRSPNNPASSPLWLNLKQIEATTSRYLDLLSNGAKVLNSSVNTNGNNEQQLFSAWALAPGKFARAR